MPVKAPRCAVCNRKIKPDVGELLFLRPDDSEVWLCGKKKCWDKYNDS